MSDRDIERLCAGYRATVEDPPYDAADAALLSTAARRVCRIPRQRVAYATAAVLLAALALGIAMRPRIATRLPASIESPRAAPVRTDPFQGLVTRMSQPAMLRQGDRGFLQETSAFSSAQPDLTCAAAVQVDLNSPGVLDHLKATRPGDYRAIRRIIAGVTRHPETDVARWISATFHAGNVSYEPLWLTSYPPKRRLRFCLQGTGYSAVLTITSKGARVEMARELPTMRQRH